MDRRSPPPEWMRADGRREGGSLMPGRVRGDHERSRAPRGPPGADYATGNWTRTRGPDRPRLTHHVSASDAVGNRLSRWSPGGRLCRELSGVTLTRRYMSQESLAKDDAP